MGSSTLCRVCLHISLLTNESRIGFLTRRARDGTAYMPIDGGGGGSDGPALPAPPVSCDFGPFKEQTRVTLETLGAQNLCKIALLAPFLLLLLRSIFYFSGLLLTLPRFFTCSSIFAGKPRPCVQRWRVRLGS